MINFEIDNIIDMDRTQDLQEVSYYQGLENIKNANRQRYQCFLANTSDVFWQFI